MSKQFEGLCPHGRHSTAVCLDCGLEADIYQPNRQIDWDAPDAEEQFERQCDGYYGVSLMENPAVKKEQEDRNEFFRDLVDNGHEINEVIKENIDYRGDHKITAQSILQEAIDAISDRAPYRDANGKKTFELASEIFGKITGHDLDEHDACMFLASIKLARSQQGEFHRDDFTDAASYIALACEARAGQVRPTGKRPKVREYLSQEGDDGRDRSESYVTE